MMIIFLLLSSSNHNKLNAIADEMSMSTSVMEKSTAKTSYVIYFSGKIRWTWLDLRDYVKIEKLMRL